MLRRDFLRNALTLAGCSAVGISAPKTAAPADAPATHNCMLVGAQSAFLSHLPMFDHLNESGEDYVTPHRYQAMMRVSFESGDKDITGLYFTDRQSHPATKMFTVSPTQQFALPELVANRSISSFKGTVFRGHLERGGQPISKLRDVTVRVAQVIHFHKFQPAAEPSTTLDYFIFGRGKELFLAHSIMKPPDFDQILSVEISGANFSDDNLNSAIRIRVPGRDNTSQKRLLEGEQATAELASGAKLNLKGIREFYFEEGELFMPATFRPTPEEAKAGFNS